MNQLSTPVVPDLVRSGTRGRSQTRLRAAGALAAALALVAIGVLVYVAEDAMRGAPIREVAGASYETRPPPLASPAFAEVAGTLIGTTLSPGNTVEILIDTEVFEEMLEDIRGPLP